MSSSEGPNLDQFLSQARDRDAASARTALLSTTSNLNLTDDVFDPNRNGPSERYRRQRELAHSQLSSREILALLITKEYEAEQSQKIIRTLFSRLRAESARASDAEKLHHENAQKFRRAASDKHAAEQEAIKAKEELKLCQQQYTLALDEIKRAREVLQQLESQRDDAEHRAAESRSLVRQLDRERKVFAAREEGRQLGFEAGFRRAQEEFQLAAAGSTQMSYDPNPLPRVFARDYAPAVESARRDDISEQTVSTVQRPMNILPQSSSSLLSVPPPLPPSGSHRRQASEPVRQPEPITEPVPLAASPQPSIRRTYTPSVQHYEVEVPPPETIERQNKNMNPRIAPAPWPGPSRSYPRTSSPYVPPDNFIPVANAQGDISLPPPNEMRGTLSPYAESLALPPLPDEDGSVTGTSKGKGKGKATESWYVSASGTSADHPWYTKKSGPPSVASSVTSKHRRRTSAPAAGSSKEYSHHRHSSAESNSSRISNSDLLQAPSKKTARELSVINENPLSRQSSLQQQRPTSVKGSDYGPPLPPKGLSRHPEDVQRQRWTDNLGRSASAGSTTSLKKSSGISKTVRGSEFSPPYEFHVEPPSQPASGNPNTTEQARYVGTPVQSLSMLSPLPASPYQSRPPVLAYGNISQTTLLHPESLQSGRASPYPARQNALSPRPSSIVSHQRRGSVNEHLSPNPANDPLPIDNSGLKRMASSRSMRSTESYAKYNPAEYLDPAYNTATLG